MKRRDGLGVGYESHLGFPRARSNPARSVRLFNWLKNRWINTFTFVGVLHMKYLLIEPYITKLLFKV